MKNKDKIFEGIFWTGIGLLFLMLALSIWVNFEYCKDNIFLKNENWSLELQNRSYKEKLQSCKEFSLFTQAVAQIGNRTYDLDNYNCVNFSKDLVKELEGIGIKSNIAISEDRTHAWVVVWIEATTGGFIRPETNLGILELRDEEMKIICNEDISWLENFLK